MTWDSTAALPPEPSNVALGTPWPQCDAEINPIHIGLPAFPGDPMRRVKCHLDRGHSGPHQHLDKRWQVV